MVRLLSGTYGLNAMPVSANTANTATVTANTAIAAVVVSATHSQISNLHLSRGKTETHRIGHMTEATQRERRRDAFLAAPLSLPPPRDKLPAVFTVPRVFLSVVAAAAAASISYLATRERGRATADVGLRGKLTYLIVWFIQN